MLGVLLGQPGTQLEVEGLPFRSSAIARSKSGVSGVTVSVNGVAQFGQAGGRSMASQAWAQ